MFLARLPALPIKCTKAIEPGASRAGPFFWDCARVLLTKLAVCKIQTLRSCCCSPFCTVTAGKIGWLAPALHHVREWSRAPRSPVTVRHCPPGLAALQWSRPGASRSEDAPWHKPDGLRSHDCEYGQSGPGQRGVRHAGCDGVGGLPPGVLVVPGDLVPDRVAGPNDVQDDEEAYPRGNFARYHSPGLGSSRRTEIVHSAVYCSPFRYFRPVAGERRGSPGFPGADVAARGQWLMPGSGPGSRTGCRRTSRRRV